MTAPSAVADPDGPRSPTPRAGTREFDRWSEGNVGPAACFVRRGGVPAGVQVLLDNGPRHRSPWTEGSWGGQGGPCRWERSRRQAREPSPERGRHGDLG